MAIVNKCCFYIFKCPNNYQSQSYRLLIKRLLCSIPDPNYADDPNGDPKSPPPGVGPPPQSQSHAEVKPITSHNSPLFTPTAIDTRPLKLLNTTSEDWKPQDALTIKTLAIYYSRLAKLRLTSLVVLTTLTGYYMSCSTITPSVLTCALVGTALTSAAATSINQLLEVPFDSQMIRTRNRPLVVNQLTPLHAFGFATVSGIAGVSLLAVGVNPLTASLGLANLVLYAFIYTPMKRAHIVNTWLGAIVGAIPPVMGCTAASGCVDLPALLLGLILFSWQFPHFNALSWNMRHDYARAGYRMMSVTEPRLCLDTSLRHAVLIQFYSLAMCTCLTTWTFAVDSAPFNLYLIYLSYKFRQEPTASSSRKLFRYSLIHLPAIIMLMIISKRRDKKEEII